MIHYSGIKRNVNNEPHRWSCCHYLSSDYEFKWQWNGERIYIAMWCADSQIFLILSQSASIFIIRFIHYHDLHPDMVSLSSKLITYKRYSIDRNEKNKSSESPIPRTLAWRHAVQQMFGASTQRRNNNNNVGRCTPCIVNRHTNKSLVLFSFRQTNQANELRNETTTTDSNQMVKAGG